MARAMRDSGVEWIGEIPEGWGVEPLNHLFSFGKGLPITKEQLIQEGLPVVSYGQIHAKSNTGTRISTDLLRYVSTEYAKLYPASYAGINTFIIADTSEDLEGCGNSVYNDSVATLFAGYHSIILRPSFTENARFYAYFFKSAAWRVQVQVQVSGVKVFSISQRILKNTVVLSPPKVEQQRIADFLDSATADIDVSIAKTRESIEEYKKLKQAVITQAVTKGIRPGRAMKDSAVEWIGEIPEEWDISTLGRVTSEMRNGYVGPTRDLFVDEGERYLQSLHIKDGGIYFEKQPYYVTRKWLSSRPTVNAGDILIVQTGDIGQVGLVTEEYAGCGCHALIIAAPDEALIFPKFLTYYLMSHTGRELVLAHKTGALLPHLNSGKIKFAFVCVPPVIAEQQEIAAYLDEKCGAIDNLIEKKQAIITELEAYKKSLIYEYVTGKKEIPAGA